MQRQLLLGKVTAAKQELTDAESNLEKALREIQVAPRADKTTVSKVVEEAFIKLRAARTNLVELEKLVQDDEA